MKSLYRGIAFAIIPSLLMWIFGCGVLWLLWELVRWLLSQI